MKRHIMTFLLVFFILIASTGLPKAADLSVTSSNIRQGATDVVDLLLSSDDQESYTGVNAGISLPSGVTVTEVTQGPLLTGGDFTILYQNYSNEGTNGVIVIAYSATDTFNAPNGVLLTLEITAAADAPLGNDFPVDFDLEPNDLINTSSALANADMLRVLSVEHTTTAGSITITPPYDDADNDGLADDLEQQIIDADPNDDINSLADVLPRDDFDGDGFSNLREFLFNSNALLSGEIPECVADFDNNGNVDGADLATFHTEFGRTDCPCPGDTEGNNTVDEIDLLFFTEDYERIDCTVTP